MSRRGARAIWRYRLRFISTPAHRACVDVSNAAELYVNAMRKQLLGWPGFNWQPAAQFCADNTINLDEALVWAERAISEPFRNAAAGREEFSTLHNLAFYQNALDALKKEQ